MNTEYITQIDKGVLIAVYRAINEIQHSISSLISSRLENGSRVINRKKTHLNPIQHGDVAVEYDMPPLRIPFFPLLPRLFYVYNDAFKKSFELGAGYDSDRMLLGSECKKRSKVE